MSEYLLIVKKIKDMIVYNNIMLKQFPKHEKYLLANKIREIGYEIYEFAITINKKFHKKTTFTNLNIKHELLRQLINLAYELKYIDSQKHRVSQLHIDEVGRMIGAWIKRAMTDDE
ncbi:diversity-generating retroelement protein Avd [Melioribacter sp. Ez-97]|uniref:diversity-generating retroelement protein Avd n=1 Tax=Melioribacter sp. Ez-97 TaxID=3423434 RepID=UPI003ED85806